MFFCCTKLSLKLLSELCYQDMISVQCNVNNLLPNVAFNNAILSHENSMSHYMSILSGKYIYPFFSTHLCRKRSGSVVECLTRDRRAAGSSLIGVTALWSLSKTHLRGSSNKEWDFCYSAVNLHAIRRKSHSKLAGFFGFSHVPHSMCYIVPIFVARQHKKTMWVHVDSSL